MRHTTRRRRKKRAIIFLSIAALFLLTTGGIMALQPEQSTDRLPWDTGRSNSPSQRSGSGEVQHTDTDADGWQLTLVNSEHPLPEDFTVQVRKVDGTDYTFDTRAADALEQMLSDCRAAGYSPIICSGYRSVEYQSQLFDQQIQKQIANGYTDDQAVIAAASVVALPGTSEHNLGLAADLVAESYQLLETDQEETLEMLWLHENCQEYGFILRYPSNKQEITGIIYEPWHFRYVGVEAAREIMGQGLCLEEYLAR